MDPAELALRKAEYYNLLSNTTSLRPILNQRGGIVLARVGSHPPWPARFSEPGEFAKMARYRTKKGQVCVYFFGSRNYGWVPKSSILPFSDDLSSVKGAKRYNLPLIEEALDEAKIVWEMTDDAGTRFYDRIMEQRNDAVDLPCELCNRVDDHYSLLILCDGKDCKREYHMNCLNPPLVTVPPGDWYCPKCQADVPPTKPNDPPSEPRDAKEKQTHKDHSGLSSKIVGPKKGRKEKAKTKDPSSKRRLSSVSPDPESRGLMSSKKSRGTRSSSSEASPDSRVNDPSPPKAFNSKVSSVANNIGSKRPPQIEIVKSRGHNTPEGESGSADEDMPSEERCLICGFGGELVVCEFQGCTKVYHQFCLGSFPFPKDEETTWFCPRHTCAVTGQKELFDAANFTSPRKLSVKNLLWKCGQCPVAVADDAIPHLPPTQILSKKHRRFLCANCAHNAPLPVQLAKLLEKIWSTMATNRQGVPFCGPLLCGLERLEDQTDELGGMNLFRVLAKIRRLDYDGLKEFVSDIAQIVKDATLIIGSQSQPLIEAARTLKIICDEQVEIHRQKMRSIENKLHRAGADKQTKSGDDVSVTSKGEKTLWPLRWRQECGPFEDKFYPQLDARTLDEWNAHVTAAPLYTSISAIEEVEGGSDVSSKPSDGNAQEDGGDHTSNGGGAIRSGSNDRLSFPGLTLSEGTDVVLALGELSRSSGDTQGRQFGVEQGSSGPDSTDGRDLFLSPSTSEMQQMFEQQSSALRTALEAHSVLQRSWMVNQQKMLGFGASSVFSIGEGRLAAELRLANKNLRERLRNKDRLVDQLTSDHMKLRAEMLSMQRQLSEAKFRVQELEGRSVQSEHPRTDHGSDAISTSEDENVVAETELASSYHASA